MLLPTPRVRKPWLEYATPLGLTFRILVIHGVWYGKT